MVLCGGKVSEAAEMGTAFTYQDRLIDANYPADGLYDFQFKLYDANTDGNQLGTDVNKPDVNVVDGYFTVILDFNDANGFNGQARWLEIGIGAGQAGPPESCEIDEDCPEGQICQDEICVDPTVTYITLYPRQELTPVPYALQTRGIFVDNAGDVGIGTTSPDAKLEADGDRTVTGAYKGATSAQIMVLLFLAQLMTVAG
jgi:hypothetical protein